MDTKEKVNISKSRANKIGKIIRTHLNDKTEIPSDLIIELQQYRVSFKEDLSKVIEHVAKVANIAGKDSVTSFRIKRIESILSKIKRIPTMQLGGMGDIAGCRIIIYRKKDLKDVIDGINQQFEVVKVNDYTIIPKDDGYNGYHVYIKSPLNNKRLLEIQLRTAETHRWASLVEIIDIIYNLKLKEGQKHPKLQKLLLHLSNKRKLNILEIEEVINIDQEFEVYSELFKAFLSNHFKIRKDWLGVDNYLDVKYLIFEVNNEKHSIIHAYTNYDEAEKKYFNMFTTQSSSNFVLAHIEKPNFKRMCMSYASYLLIQHDYLEDWNSFIIKLLNSDNSNISKKFRNIIEYSKRNLNLQVQLIDKELEQIRMYEKEKSVNTESLIEWKEEVYSKLQALPSRKSKLSFRDIINWFLNNLNK